MAKAKLFDLDDFFIQVLLKGKNEIEINKFRISASLFTYPKTLCVNMECNINGSQGMGSSVCNLEEAYSMIRSYYRNCTKQDLPESVIPPSRVWYVEIILSNLIPIFIGPYQPNLEDFLITNTQTGEEEYFFNVPAKYVPHFDFDRVGDTIYVPKYKVYERSLTDYVPQKLVYTATSHL